MGGIHRFEDGRVQVYTTLQANGWACTHNQLPYRAVYERGDEVIELERDGVAFYSVGDRRVSNGTWQAIVERYAVGKEEKRDSHDEIAGLIGRLDECLSMVDVILRDEVIGMLERYDATLEG